MILLRLNRVLIGLVSMLAGLSTVHPMAGRLHAADERTRLIIETDAGGDPDDEQSLVRLLVYANEFEIEGIIANRPRARDGENQNPIRDGLGIVRAMIHRSHSTGGFDWILPGSSLRGGVCASTIRQRFVGQVRTRSEECRTQGTVDGRVHDFPIERSSVGSVRVLFESLDQSLNYLQTGTTRRNQRCHLEPVHGDTVR